MSSRALRVCAETGCAALVASGPRCPAHTRPTRVQSPEQRRFYSSTFWRKTSEHIRRERPVCEVCGKEPSSSVDHVSGDWTDNRRENLQAIGRTCHLKKSGAEHRRKVR